jgi:hypothetical protein
MDPFRPNLQLKNFLEFLADHPNLTPKAVQAAAALQENAVQKNVCEFTMHAITSEWSFSQYRLSEKTLHPASRPHHYDRLVEAFEKS